VIGKTLAHYEITGLLGKGGMGVVYSATDTKLRRDVAIKVLPDDFAQDQERLARFEREAHILASLNHTGIASIYGLEESGGNRFLVMELVPGETIADRLAKGALPVDEALRVARQIAEALEEAHEHAIIHRDLKPANIMVTADGKVRVLDFGLARALSIDGTGQDLSQSPTATFDMTRSGVILGTAPYMSPEQARGKPVDKRTDIFAFGSVIYEMLAGQRAFGGDTVSDTIAAILEREPELERLPPATPTKVSDLLRRCLKKDPHQRLHDIADARIEIDDALAGGTDTAMPPFVASRGRRWMGWAIGAVLGALVGVAAMILFGPDGSQESPRIRFTVAAPIGITVENPTLSPNARWLAYSTKDGVRIHDLERDESHALPSLKDANQFVFFSPNSDWIGFHADTKLQKVRATGGVPVDLVEVGPHPGATWGSRNTIVYPLTWASGLFEVPDDGGEPRQVTTLDPDQGETAHWSPHFLPDGRHVLFTVFTTRGSLNHSRMDLLDLDTGERVPLGVGAYPVYLNSGHIVYHRSGLYEIAPFDLARKAFAGPPRIVLENVPYVHPWGTRARFFSVSDNGVLATIAVDEYPAAGPRSLYRLHRNGVIEPLGLPPSVYNQFEVSPDGKRLASEVHEAGERDLWVYDLERGTGRRITRESNNRDPHWHPDSRRIAFRSTRLGSYDAFLVDVDSGDPPTTLLTAEQDAFPHCWTPDGALIAGISTIDQSDNIVILEDSTTSDLVATDVSETNACVSHDGQWIAYASDRSGREEVYVQPLTRSGNAIQVSTGGGDNPQWSRTTHELVFVEGPSEITRLGGIAVGEIMVVNYEVRDGRFVTSRPEPYLRDNAGETLSGGARRVFATDVFGDYNVSADGQLIISLFETSPNPRVHVALDGFGELERQAAADR